MKGYMKKKNDVLVLNRAYIPIQIIEWQRAMSLLIQDAARPLDRNLDVYDFDTWLSFSSLNEDYPKISTIRYKIALPEIVVLRKYDKLPIRDVKYSRMSLFERDRYTCCFCNQKFPKLQLTVDHILPRSKGGTTSWMNTITSCKPCNSLKADRTPEQAHMKMHFKPKKPMWISPVSKMGDNHPCKSWLKFLDRVLV